MRVRRFAILFLVLFLSSNLTLAQTITRYGFDQTFISSHYTDSAIGDITATQFHPAANVHSTSCGGNDAGIEGVARESATTAGPEENASSLPLEAISAELDRASQILSNNRSLPGGAEKV